jgi:amidohydrolase
MNNDLTNTLLPLLIKWRRHIHQYPELGYEETKTQQFIIEILKSFGIKEIQKIGGTGVVALIKGSRPGKTIAIRSDMDALPIEEETNVEYKSKIKGKMHACGHDGHIAIVLGTAYLLYSTRDTLHGNVKLIFQPAEELSPPNDGARKLVKENVLDNPKVDAIIGLHLIPGLNPHHISMKTGVIMSMINEFTIVVTGKESHGSTPEKGINSIYASSELIGMMNMDVIHNVKEKATINIGVINGGTKMNIVPKETIINGSFRSLSISDTNTIIDNMKYCCKKIAQKYKVKIKFELHPSSKPVKNDPKLIKLFKPVVEKITRSFDETYIASGSEDFGEYTENIPGVFFFLGSMNGTTKTSCHSSNFDMDENVLLTGSLLLSNCAKKYLI